MTDMTSTRSNEKRKQVSFMDSPAQVQNVPTIDDYTDEEYEGTWQTEEDGTTSQSELLRTVKIARANHGSICQRLEESEQVTSRGIEAICAGSGQVRHLLSVKRSVIDAVLDEQERLDELGASDTEVIAEAIMRASEEHSRLSSARALARAAEDAAFALREARITDE